MGRADLSVAQIIDFDAFDNTRLWSSYLKRPEIDGLIYLEYSRYDGLKGRVVWSEGKPVISARTMLWDGLDGADEASVTAELNAATRNLTPPPATRSSCGTRGASPSTTCWPSSTVSPHT